MKSGLTSTMAKHSSSHADILRSVPTPVRQALEGPQWPQEPHNDPDFDFDAVADECRGREWSEALLQHSCQGLASKPVCSPVVEASPEPTETCFSEELQSFRISVDDPVGGLPYGQGELFMMEEGSQQLQLWTVLIFSTGLYAVDRESGIVKTYAWSPFSTITGSAGVCIDGGSTAEDFYGFTLTIPTRGRYLLLATSGPDGKHMREQWLADMSRAQQDQTKSLFRDVGLDVDPLLDNSQTKDRIVAGFLLMRGADPAEIVAPFCELQAYRQGAAQLFLYESEKCRNQVASLTITASSRVFERGGIGCTCFSIDGHSFSARSVKEKQLWLSSQQHQGETPDSVLRAISSRAREFPWSRSGAPSGACDGRGCRPSPGMGQTDAGSSRSCSCESGSPRTPSNSSAPLPGMASVSGIRT